MSSLIKTFYTNHIYHDNKYSKNSKIIYEVRFTKILTKYSTEYNNSLFIQNLCQELNLDIKDMFAFFLEIRKKFDEEQIYNIFESYEITRLDIDRIYRYLDKYIKTDIDEIEEKYLENN